MTKNVSLCAEVDRPRWVVTIFLLLLGLAFLQPLQVWPFETQFETVGLGAGCLVLAGLQLIVLKRYWLGPLLWVWLGFGGLLLVSALVVPQAFYASLYAYGWFWVVGLAVIQLGAIFTWQQEPQRFAEALAWFLVLVGGLSVLLGCVKSYQLWGELSRYVPAPFESRMSGLVGQSNLFSVLSLLGCLALLWLASIGRLAVWQILLAVVVFAYGLTLGGSRIVFPIYLAVVLLALVQGAQLRRWRFAGALLGFALFFLLASPFFLQWDQWLRQELISMGLLQSQLVASEVFERGVESPRWIEWPLAWQMFIENLPWGVGPGGYPAHSYGLHLREGVLPLDAIWLHSHNSYLQLWIEFGWLGVCWSLVMGWVVMVALWKAVRLDQPVVAIVLLALLIHSFFEFPLWSMHFFVLGFWVLAAGQQGREVEGKPLLGAILALVGALVLMFYTWLFAGLVAWYTKTQDGETVSGAELKFVDRLVQDPLLKPYGLQFYYFYFPPGSLSVEIELKELEALRAYRPYGFYSVRYSILLAAVGRQAEALAVRDEILRVSPVYKDVFLDGVDEAMQAHPDWALRGLLDFSGQGLGDQ